MKDIVNVDEKLELETDGKWRLQMIASIHWK